MKETQLGLFDRPATPDHSHSSPLARTSDPETSKIAADRVVTAPLKLKFLEALAGLGGEATAGEIEQYWLDRGATSRRAQSIRKRKRELEKGGVIRIIAERPCTTTGEVCGVFKAIK